MQGRRPGGPAGRRRQPSGRLGKGGYFCHEEAEFDRRVRIPAAELGSRKAVLPPGERAKPPHDPAGSSLPDNLLANVPAILPRERRQEPAKEGWPRPACAKACPETPALPTQSGNTGASNAVRKHRRFRRSPETPALPTQSGNTGASDAVRKHTSHACPRNSTRFTQKQRYGLYDLHVQPGLPPGEIDLHRPRLGLEAAWQLADPFIPAYNCVGGQRGCYPPASISMALTFLYAMLSSTLFIQSGISTSSPARLLRLSTISTCFSTVL